MQLPLVGKSVRLVLSLATALSFSSAALADPVRIVTFGHADAHEGDSTFGLIGSGFQVAGESFDFGTALGDCWRCEPGTVVHLEAHGTPERFADELFVVDGRTHQSAFLVGDLFFHAGTLKAPVLPVGGFTELFAPFAFTGHLSAFDNFDLSGAPLFSLKLRGAGTVGVH